MSKFYVIRDSSGVFYTCQHWPDERFCDDCLIGALKEKNDLHARLRESEAREAEIQEWLVHDPNPTENMGTFEECRICRASRSRKFNDEWAELIHHRPECLISSSPSPLLGLIERMGKALKVGFELAEMADAELEDIQLMKEALEDYKRIMG